MSLLGCLFLEEAALQVAIYALTLNLMALVLLDNVGSDEIG